MKRLTQDEFIEGSVTLGVEFNAYQAKIEDSYLKMQIWDTAGQENFRSITKVFYRNTHAVLVCYAINNRQSYYHVKEWLNEAKEQCDPDVLVFLTGCKSDLNDKR